MIYQANQELNDYVRKKARGSLYGAFSAITLFVILGFGFYYNTSSKEMFLAGIVGAFVISCGGVYSFTVMEGVKLSKLVKEVTIVNNTFTFKTYSYRCLFYLIPQEEYKLRKGDFEIQEISFPFNSVGISNNNTYRIILNEVKIYVCYQCFDGNLYSELNTMPG